MATETANKPEVEISDAKRESRIRRRGLIAALVEIWGRICGKHEKFTHYKRLYPFYVQFYKDEKGYKKGVEFHVWLAEIAKPYGETCRTILTADSFDLKKQTCKAAFATSNQDFHEVAERLLGIEERPNRQQYKRNFKDISDEEIVNGLMTD